MCIMAGIPGQQRGEQVIPHLHEDEMTQINAEGHGCHF